MCLPGIQNWRQYLWNDIQFSINKHLKTAASVEIWERTFKGEYIIYARISESWETQKFVTFKQVLSTVFTYIHCAKSVYKPQQSL